MMVDQAINQLKEACKHTNARWITWLEHSESGWYFSTHYGLSKSRQKALQQLINHPKTGRWLAGALTNGRVRSRSTRNSSSILGCQRVYAFPNQLTHSILVVGSDGLDTYAEILLRILSMQPGSLEPDEYPHELKQDDLPLWPLEPGHEDSYDPQRTLESILQFLAGQISCCHAFLAIRAGEIFHIHAVWDAPSISPSPILKREDISVLGDKFLSFIMANHLGIIIENLNQASKGLQKALTYCGSSWMCVPIIIGQRVIGIVGFTSTDSHNFGTVELDRITWHSNRLSYSIENAITFKDVERYLRQLALLNELASMASVSVEPNGNNLQDEFARRLMVRLKRVFKTDWAAALLLSPDGNMLHEVGGNKVNNLPFSIMLAESIMGIAVKTAQPTRVGNLQNFESHFILDPELNSELVVPMKYRGRVIGVLALASKENHAFTQPDEQLLVLIASHMAGFFENMRLNEETRERASSLADSVRQLQAVRDTSLDIAGDLDLNTLLSRVARRARDIVDARGAELGLFLTHEKVVEIVVSDVPWENGQRRQIPLMADVAGQVAALGEPLIINEYNSWKGRLFKDHQASFLAEAGVPLILKGEVIGTLAVLDDRPEKQFTKEDVHILELLAPQAAISIHNARLYQELESRIQAQQIAESHMVRSARLAAVGEMAAGVAHELNNPLTTVIGFVELVLEELPTESQQRNDLQLVLEEANRARGVIRRLLDFSRPSEKQRIRTNLSDLVQQVLPLVNHLARTGGVNIHTELIESVPWIPLDPNQMKQVLLNLIHNGLQAMPNGGTLSITTFIQTCKLEGVPTDCLAVQIKDTGDGIPPENLERIFEPFFSTRPSGKGTGLGLSVSYGIVTSHGGWIDVESTPGNGSSFTILLPITIYNERG